MFRQIIDLTHTLNENAPTWNGGCGFSCKTVHDYSDHPEYTIKIQKISCFAGVGTHLDAPTHFFAGGLAIDKIALTDLICPLRVIDLSARCSQGLKLIPEDVLEYEASYGPLNKGDFVIFYSGWSQYWMDSQKYRNPDQEGIMQYPTYSKEAVEVLLKRGISGIGIDTLSPDPAVGNHPVHHLVLKENKYIVENIANLSEVSPRGFHVGIFPIKGEGLTEAPVRMVAFLLEELF